MNIPKYFGVTLNTTKHITKETVHTPYGLRWIALCGYTNIDPNWNTNHIEGKLCQRCTKPVTRPARRKVGG